MQCVSLQLFQFDDHLYLFVKSLSFVTKCIGSICHPKKILGRKNDQGTGAYVVVFCQIQQGHFKDNPRSDYICWSLHMKMIPKHIPQQNCFILTNFFLKKYMRYTVIKVFTIFCIFYFQKSHAGVPIFPTPFKLMNGHLMMYIITIIPLHLFVYLDTVLWENQSNIANTMRIFNTTFRNAKVFNHL